jgi:subtilisin family serine protease
VTWQDTEPYFDWPHPPGKTKPTVTAPGLNTVSTSHFSNCTDYALNSGTSMAAPHIAGTVALMLEANPSLDHLDVKEALVAAAIDLGDPGVDNIYGAGRVDALAAVQGVLGSPADLDGDGVVGVLDMIQLILAWGPCPPGPCAADLDGDGEVGVLDLIELIMSWG